MVVLWRGILYGERMNMEYKRREEGPRKTAVLLKHVSLGEGINPKTVHTMATQVKS